MDQCNKLLVNSWYYYCTGCQANEWKMKLHMVLYCISLITNDFSIMTFFYWSLFSSFLIRLDCLLFCCCLFVRFIYIFLNIIFFYRILTMHTWTFIDTQDKFWNPWSEDFQKVNSDVFWSYNAIVKWIKVFCHFS